VKIPALTTQQMVEVDRLMIEEFGITLIQMMENAGRDLADLARRMFGGEVRGKRVAAFCGAGNNGARCVGWRPAIAKTPRWRRRAVGKVGWSTSPKLQRLPGGITYSQSVGFHQFLHLVQIAFMLSLDRSSEEWHNQLEEAAHFRFISDGEASAAFDALKGPLECQREWS